MELKSSKRELVNMALDCSNRTFMELKLTYNEVSQKAYRVLIVPLWN